MAVQRVLAILALIASVPLIALFALAIGLGSGGPVLVRLTREGHHRHPFPMTKLRTMVVDAEQRLAAALSTPEAQREWATYGCLMHDPRIAGHAAMWARRLSIDELPQLWDVVCGRMALVGPRPLPYQTADLIADRWRTRRAMVRPGMTGLWQVSGRADVNLKRMIALDLLYARQRRPVLDIAILFRTPWTVLSSRGAY